MKNFRRRFWFGGLLLAQLVLSPFPSAEILAEAIKNPGIISTPHPRNSEKASSRRMKRKRPLDFHVINLDCDKERWESVVAELTSKGVPRKRIKRIHAIYGKNLTSDDLHTNATFVARHFSTPGTIGCYMSHRSCWEQTAAGSEPYQLFLEDDVLVADNFPNKVYEILQEIDVICPETRDGNWDVIFLGALG